MIIKKILQKSCLSLFLSFSLLQANNTEYIPFGEDLFNGSFTQNNINIYNPNYVFNIGDTIDLKIWGAINYNYNLTIDNNGVLFIPNIGIIKLVGTKNKDLYKNIEQLIKTKYKDNVFFYANINSYTPINVFISGAVEKPGLYKGLSNDSILQYLEQAKGLKENGSFRSIDILRDNQVIHTIDLYSYLLNGNLYPFQFKSGDVINVRYLKSYILVDGEIEKPIRIELKENSIDINQILQIANVKPGVFNYVVQSSIKNNINSKMYNILEDIKIHNRNIVTFIKSQTNKNIHINISGEHESLNKLILPKGTTLKSALDKIDFSNISSTNDIILYRKSIALKQKELINSSLDNLERKILQTGSSTLEEANIRKTEVSSIKDFISKAREVETKGQVVISKNTNLEDVILEEGDEIYIPKVSNIVNIYGAVQVPTSMTYNFTLDIKDYIEKCGGLTEEALENEVLVIKLNGEVVRVKDTKVNIPILSEITNSLSTSFGFQYNIEPGDSILVLSKVDSKDLQVTKDISQILYQLAVSAGVLLTL